MNSKCEEKVCDKKALVKITINGKEYQISSGQWFIYDLKEIGCVPKDHAFAEIKGCNFFEFSDEAATNIHGGEIFKSYQCNGANS